MKRGVGSCLIMQHKSYIVEQATMCPFKSDYHYTKVCKLVYRIAKLQNSLDDRDREYIVRNQT